MSNLVSFTPKYPQFPSDIFVKLRHRSGLSQSQLAQLLGLKSERMVLYWEGGYSLPPAARLRKLIELFLAKGGFLPGHETVEIEQLWTVVKDFYDNTRGKNLPYPVFDRTWAAVLVGTSSTTIKNKIPPTPALAKTLEATRQHQNEDTTLATPALPVKPDLPGGATLSPQAITPPNNLSRFQTSAALLGREKELQDLEARLIGPGGCLIVLTGPGGVGKTRLALELAAKVLNSFTDGVYFVNLADISESGQVPAAIGQALNLKVQSTTPDEELDRICQQLAGKKLLLILDNFEQLAQSTASLSRLFSLVGEDKGELKILITSRVNLNIYTKQRYSLDPLELPLKSTQTLTRLPVLLLEHFQLLKESSPVRIFVERARLVRADFCLTPQNALAIARICELVDGLPLALELAAARIQLFTPQALCKRLEENAGFTSGAYRESGENRAGSGYAVLKWLNYNQGSSYTRRQDNLRRTLEWSYNLLGKDQQHLFRNLAVFRGGFNLEAVCAICYSDFSPASNSEITNVQGLEEAEVLNSLAGLINNSLLKSNYDQDGEPRFEMLKTISEFATELLDQSIYHASAQELRQRHADYYLKLAEEALPHYQGPEQVNWFDRIGNEHDNMLVALEYLSKAALLKPAARLVYALNSFWFRKGLMSLGVYWAKLTVAAIEKVENEPGLKKWHGRLLWQLGTYIGHGSKLESALQLIEKGLDLSTQAEDTEQIIQDYHSLGYIKINQGRMEEAMVYLEQGATLARSDKNYSFFLTGILTNLATVLRNKKNYDKAQIILNEGLTLSQQQGYKSSELMFLGTLGQLCLDWENPDKAESYFTQALQVAREIKALNLAAIVHLNLAGLEIFNKSNLLQAKFHLKQALLFNLERDFKLGQITVIILVGVILARQGEVKLAAQLAATIEVELQELGQKLHGQELQWYQTFREIIETGLGREKEKLAQFYTGGNCMPFSQALCLALEQLN